MNESFNQNFDLRNQVHYENLERMQINSTNLTDYVDSKPLKRAWNKAQIQNLFDTTKSYCIIVGRPVQFLTYEDYSAISAMINQPILKCIKKLREICSTGSLAQGAWSSAEDGLLVHLINSAMKKWGHIAEYLNYYIHSGFKLRSGKQCKERWLNHLDPKMKRDKWNEHEDLRVFKLYQTLGNRWSDISKIIGNRTDSSIKNRVKSLINKQKQSVQSINNNSLCIESIIKSLEESINNSYQV